MEITYEEKYSLEVWFTGEVPYAKTELQSFGSFPHIRELTYSQFSNWCCIDASFKWISALFPSH